MGDIKRMELIEAKKTLAMLARRCENARNEAEKGSTQWHSLNKRLSAMNIACALVDEKLASKE